MPVRKNIANNDGTYFTLVANYYYPFGLAMNGIGSKAVGILFNKEKTFQGQRFDDDLGLNWDQFKWRNHDPQLGRFIEIDPLSEKYVYNSTYAFSENKVTGHVEIEGLEAANANDINNPLVRAALKDDVQKPAASVKQNSQGAIKVSVSVGVGVGVKAKVGKSEIGASVNGPQVQASIDGGRNVEVKGSCVGVNMKLETPVGEAKTGGDAGVVEFKDGRLNFSPGTGGSSADVSVKKDVTPGTSMGANILDTEISLGVKFYVVGAEVNCNIKKAAVAVKDAFVSFGNWLSNSVSEIANQSSQKRATSSVPTY